MSIRNDKTTTKRKRRRSESRKTSKRSFSTGKVTDKREKDNIKTVLSRREILFHSDKTLEKIRGIIAFTAGMDFLPKIMLATIVLKGITVIDNIVTRTVTMGDTILTRIDLAKGIRTKRGLKRGRAKRSEKIMRGKRGDEISGN